MKAFLAWILALLGNECGQVPTDDETVEETTEVAEPTEEVATDSEDPDAIAGEQAQPEAQASFFDPKQIDALPLDEATKAQLRQTWKAMHGGYNKWIQTERNPLREKAAVVDRFYADRSFAQQTLLQWAAQNGYQLTPIGQQQNGQQQQAMQPQAGKGAPPELVDAIKQTLPPELQWMAESQAAAHWAASRLSMKPYEEQQQQAQRQQHEARQRAIDQAYEEASAELREKAPDWEQKEAELSQLWDFLTSSQMKSQKFGNKLELLWNMLNGNATAVAEAVKRQQSAVKNRSSSSMGQTRTVNNLQDRIRQAPSSRDAFRIAAQAAMDKFGGD